MTTTEQADWLFDAEEVPDGTLSHWVTCNGLRFESRFQTHDGASALLAVEWFDLDTARANYENARRGALQQLPKVRARLAGVDGTDVSTRRTLASTGRGRLMLYTNTGAPTWWLPRAGLVWRDGVGVKGGWLRACFVLTWEAPRKPADRDPLDRPEDIS